MSYPGLDQIDDPILRQALTAFCDRLNAQERRRRGVQTPPALSATLDFGDNRATAIASPVDEQDAVTREFMHAVIEQGYTDARTVIDQHVRGPQPQPPTPTPNPQPHPPGVYHPPTPFPAVPFTPAGAHPNQPSAAKVRDVQASFCSMLDSTGRPIFDPAILGLSASDRADWYARKHAAGVTHIAICAWLVGPPYRSAGFTYNVPGWDFSSSPASYLALLNEMVTEGFVPIVFLSNGQFPAPGQSPPAEYTSLTATAQFIAYLRSTTFDFGPCCLWAEAWEPGWTSDQFGAMFNMMRVMLGSTALLAMHPIAGYIHNGAGPADWDANGCWGEVDVFLGQFNNTTPPLDPTPSWYSGLIELCDRLMAPGTPLPAAAGIEVYDGQPHSGAAEGPYYLGAHGKEVTVCCFEYLAFQYIRQIDGVDDAWVRTMQTLMSNLGFHHYGHLPG